ncbi:MAG TPA: malonyl-ACP O-methyltransferase BioC [Spongiibacteraceae bacterium]
MQNQTWYCERVPAVTDSARAPDLVLLHGWGMSSDVWRAWLPLLRRRCNVILLDLPGFGRSPAQPELSSDALLDQLKPLIPARAALLGWSLGGAIALAFAQRFPAHCTALMTIACNPCFVARDDWQTAMTATTFCEFQQQIAQNPTTTLQRFLALQVRGGDGERELLRWLRLQPQAENVAALTWALNLLAQLDMRTALQQCAVPCAHLFGGADALVPAIVAEKIGMTAPQHWAVVIDGAAHLPFISHAELCWQHLYRLLAAAKLLMRAPLLQREKKAVANSFGRAASSYDGAAELQRQVATNLLAQSEFGERGNVLDLGCGTGVISEHLARSHNVIALDLAEGMLDFARARDSGTKTHNAATEIDNSETAIHWLCADAENLPLADVSIDAIFSSLALQWCENLGAVFVEIERVLRDGGSVWISTLGPETLTELRAAWHAVDAHIHVNQFAARDEIEAALRRTNLTVLSWREENIVMRYRELRELTHELKALGAHNVNSGRPDGLTSRTRLQRFSAAYDARRDAQGLLPATYQVWYLRLAKNR